jgi:hypothetical protein
MHWKSREGRNKQSAKVDLPKVGAPKRQGYFDPGAGVRHRWDREYTPQGVRQIEPEEKTRKDQGQVTLE